jgi:hypothetical protein
MTPDRADIKLPIGIGIFGVNAGAAVPVRHFNF